MPPVNTPSARSAKTGAKSARKSSARKTSSTRRPSSSARNSTRAKETATRDTASVFGDYAERALLIPVGAALIARDRVLESVNNTISIYGSPAKAQAQLRRFERRGVTARNRLEREVRKTRVRVERELRQRRREIEKTVNDLEKRRDAVAKDVPELASRVQERILSLV
jgi:hypothetical protein